MPEQAKCRSCGAAIIWVRSASTNNLMPLDAAPSLKGNITVKDGVAHVHNGSLFEEMMDGPRYINHFATCPAAEKHRQRKEKKGEK